MQRAPVRERRERRRQHGDEGAATKRRRGRPITACWSSLLLTAAALAAIATWTSSSSMIAVGALRMMPCNHHRSSSPVPSPTAETAFGLSRMLAAGKEVRAGHAFMLMSSSSSDPTPTPLASSSSSSMSSPSSLANNVNNSVKKKNDSSLAAPKPQPATTTTSSTTPAQPVKKKLQPLGRYLEVECWKRHELRDLEPVLTAVGHACKQINRIVQRAQTDDLYGAATVGADGSPLDGTNVQGEVQQKLDVVCNTIMLRSFCGGGSGAIAAVASEEEDEPRSCVDVMMWNQPRAEVGSSGSAFRLGNYVAVFDPIDGSANIDSSLPVGTVFGIYRAPAGTESTAGEGTAAPFLQRGDGNLVAAGYCLYSATTVLVLTLGSGVDGFTLDPDYGTFLHTHRDVRIPAAGQLYSFNEANFRDFSEPVRRYLDALKSGSSSVGSRATARYVGALVADVHNVLMKGGIYGYPATRANPSGKLRLLYECCPMAMIVEQAGGAASTGRGRILDVHPREIHQRSPVFLGSIENVYELDQFHRYYGDDDDDDGEEGEDLDDDYLIQHVA